MDKEFEPLDERKRIIRMWRKAAKGFSGLVTTPDEKLEQGFIDRYKELKNKMLFEPNRWKRRLSWLAIGLMTYGHLSAIEDVLESIPKPKGSHEGPRTSYIAPILIDLLPIPNSLTDGYYIRENPEELRKWYEKHKENLIWDKDQNRFVLQNNA